MGKSGKNAGKALLGVIMSLALLTACGGDSDNNNTGGGDDEVDKSVFAPYVGIWQADNSSYDGIVIDEDGSWELYKGGELYSSGELNYMEEGVWISPQNNTQWSALYIESDGSLSSAPIGYFRPFEGEWNGSFGAP